LARVLPHADDKLKKLFPGTKTDMFKMQKLLSRHCKTNGEGTNRAGAQPAGPVAPAPSSSETACTAERRGTAAVPCTADVVGASDDDDEEEEEEEQAPKPKSKPAPKKARRSSSVGDNGEERKPGGFTKQCRLVDARACGLMARW
jgi:hypothetical protein